MTDFDPFAPQDEAPVDPWAENTPSQETPNVQIGSSPVTVQPAGKISLTVKQHTGHDAPWIVFYADSAAEAKQMLREAINEDLLNAMAITQKTFAATAQGGGGGQRPAQAQGSPQGGGQQAPQGGGSDLPPGVEQKYCQHGPMTYRTGNGKFGPYQAFYCPTPKGTQGQCKGIYL